jgi:hypothetical protein
MDFLVSWPTWAIMALVGAIAGAIGGVIALAFRSRFAANSRVPALITVVAVAIGVGVGNAVVIPALADSDAADCRAAEAGAAELNRTRAGTRIDELTTTGVMTVDCAARSMSYTFAVSRPRSEFTAAAIDGIRSAFDRGQCSNAVWRNYIDEGWTVANVYTFTDAATETMVATCTTPPTVPVTK